MNPLPIELVEGTWHVLCETSTIPCSSKADAQILAQISVQHTRFRSTSSHPDRTTVEAIVDLEREYPTVQTMFAFRELKRWLKEDSDAQH